ncbi:MAG: OmpA family protein [Pseudomonadota bacterium]
MTRLNLTACLSLLGLLAIAPNVHADAAPGQGFINVAATYIDDDPDRAVDDEVGGGQLGIGYAVNDRWDVEAYLQKASLSGPGSQDQFGFGFDVRHVFNRAGRFSPYLFAGAGRLEVDPDIGRRDDGGMVSAGVGFFADIFGNSNVALRTEYRLRSADTDGPSLQDDLISVGLQIPFGRVEKPMVDSDGDGIADGLDRCPATPANARVDQFGCEVDGDGDGIPDRLDQCADTRAGATVDARGCELDDDGDGIPNGVDACPNTAPGVPVDERGCERDSDNDGVGDGSDQCPNTADGVRVDVRGCEIRDAINLPSVRFETNSDRLAGGAESSLDDAVQTLKRYEELQIEVEGHTDSDGAAEYNEGLSLRRALTVRDYLIDNGIAADRLSARGYGESQPIADNASADGKRQNRRVVLRILN